MILNVEYWHWYLFSIFLVTAEIFIPGFVLIWLGIGGFFTGTILLLFKQISLSIQIIIWTVTSGLLIFWWFKIIYIRTRNISKTNAGMAKEEILNTKGKVVQLSINKNNGVAYFINPVMGSKEWQFICNESVSLGDKVVVINISGNTFIVNKI